MSFAPVKTLGCRVLVEPLDATRWRLVEPLRYIGDREDFIVPAGYVTDFATVPRIAVWLVPKFGLYTPAAILHDWLITDRLSTGRIDSADVDGLFRRAMRELGVPPVRRWLMWAGVRWGALFNRRRRAGWSGTAPAVLVVSIPALIFAPVMLAVGVGLAVYGLAEFIVTLPMRRKTTAGSLTT